MIFADHSIYDDLRDNIIFVTLNLDLLVIEKQTDDHACDVLVAYNNLSPHNATEGQVRRFNAACAAYRTMTTEGQ